MDDFAALHALQAPGTMVYGYRTGDPVPASVVESWELEVGLDVRPLHTGAVARPDNDADRERWEAYAIGQGMSYDDAQAASLAELRKTPEPEVDEETGGPVDLPDPDAPPARPEPDALKADWVAYVIAMGADRTWAEDRSTTKADLQDWEPKRDFPASPETQLVPPSTDTVATSATQAQADANEQS